MYVTCGSYQVLYIVQLGHYLYGIYAAIIKLHDALSKDMVLHVNPTESFYPGPKVNVTGLSADTIST
jgi:hypothetical protein